MSESYSGQQFVGIDLHRRRSVIVRTTAAGDLLESVRIVNDVDRLAAARARTEPHPNDSSSGWATTTRSRIRQV